MKKSCKNCKFDIINCLIYRKLKQQDRDFYIANKFVFYGDFYCSEWENKEIKNE